MESRKELWEAWGVFRHATAVKDRNNIALMIASRKKALVELEKENPELYEAATQVSAVF